MVSEYYGSRLTLFLRSGGTGAEDAPSLDPRFPTITDSPGEVITLSRHSRKPRRQSRLVLVLQAALVMVQLVLVLLEGAAAIASALGDLW
jgi:hypothetical protein